MADDDEAYDVQIGDRTYVIMRAGRKHKIPEGYAYTWGKVAKKRGRNIRLETWPIAELLHAIADGEYHGPHILVVRREDWLKLKSIRRPNLRLVPRD
jgi:hypothetical protein